MLQVTAERDGFLERGAASHPPARGSGERCKLPRGTAPAEIRFGAF